MRRSSDHRGTIRMLYGLFGVALCVLGILYYTSAIGMPTGHKSRKLTNVTPESTTKRAKVWDAVAVDEHANPTAFALTELDGTHLAALLRKKGFAWSDGMGWTRADTTVAVLDADGAVVERKAAVALEAGCVDTGCYFMMATTDYADLASAYDALVAQTMVADGPVADGVGMTGVAYGPTMLDYRVFMVMGEGNVTMYLFGPDSVAAGTYDRVAAPYR